MTIAHPPAARHLLALLCVAAATGRAVAAEPVLLDSVLITFVDDLEVPARQLGLLDEMQIREGDRVAKGQLMARLDTGKLDLVRDRAKLEHERAQLEAASEAEVTYAVKALEVAKAELARANESLQKFRDSISKSEIERMKLEVARAEAGVQRAEQERRLAEVTARIKQTELREAERELELAEIRAPLDGLVLEVKRDAGEWVEPGQTVIRLVRIDRLRAEGFLDLSELRRVRPGAAVTLSVRLPGDTGDKRSELPGKLVFVSPQVDPVNGQFRVWAELENAGTLLRPGLEASMRIEAAP